MNGTKVFRKGAELDAYALEALRQHPGDPAGMASHGRTRETVYLDWLTERLGPAVVLDRKATRLARFGRVRIARGGAGPEGPDATIHGVLEVRDPEQFTALLARGVGRHCAYGYGMLLVSGVSTPPGFQREIGVKAQGSSRSISEAGWSLAMASSVAFR